MTEAPKRIWVHPRGVWFGALATNETTEYVRKDVADLARPVTVDAAISAVEQIPTREERLGGQTFRYVHLSEVLDALRALSHEGGE